VRAGRNCPRIVGVERGVRVTGPLPAARAWERYAVPTQWAVWAPQIRAVDASAGRIAPGVTGRVRGLLGITVTFVVTDVDEQRRTWAWDVRCGPVRMQLRHGVEPDPRGAATWLVVRGPAPVVVTYLPVARLALRRLVRP
jgi:hypothetical protein